MSAIAASDLILHQYDVSPFSEKARLMLGFKRMSWLACNQSVIMPKPELVALTGGYRQIPVLQIGADIYCGTELIAEELERLCPEPSFFAASGQGVGLGLAGWSDETLFWLTVDIVCGSGFAAMDDPAFVRDRREMLGDSFDAGRMQAALPANIDKLRAHLDLLDRQLRDGRAFLFGSISGIADISFFHPLDFLALCRNDGDRLLDGYPVLRAWMGRVRAIGHGVRRDVSREDALAVARRATPASLEAREGRWQHPPRARFTCWTPGTETLEGDLVLAAPRRIAISRTSASLGDIIVHLPRAAGTLSIGDDQPHSRR